MSLLPIKGVGSTLYSKSLDRSVVGQLEIFNSTLNLSPNLRGTVVIEIDDFVKSFSCQTGESVYAELFMQFLP